MMMPAVDSWLMTRKAPTARTSDWRNERNIFESPPSPLATSLAVSCAARYLTLMSCHVVQPAASCPWPAGLRRFVAPPPRARCVKSASREDAFAGPRVRVSVRTVMPTEQAAHQCGHADPEMKEESRCRDKWASRAGQTALSVRLPKESCGPDQDRAAAAYRHHRRGSSAEDGPVNHILAAQAFVEVAANPRAYSISDQIQAALKGVEHRRKEQERDQCRYATSRQHPIVNLKHEE